MILNLVIAVNPHLKGVVAIIVVVYQHHDCVNSRSRLKLFSGKEHVDFLHAICTRCHMFVVDACYYLFSDDADDEPFEFIPPELEPKIEPALKEKAEKAVKVVAKLSFTQTLAVPEAPKKKEKKAHDSKKLSCFPSSKTKGKKKEKPPATKLSARLKQASSQGFQIMKNILFPSIPALFQDLWVYFEMAIAIIAFVFGALDTFQSNSKSVYTYVYFILAVVSFTLVLSDGYLYFIELGSCARGYKFLRNMWKEKSGQQEEPSEDQEQESGRKCCRLSPKWKQHFSTWFEVIRNTVTELILYPLLIFDLLSFIVERGYEPSDTMQRADFSLFVMESFYLILSVYVMWLVLVLSSMISLIKLPSDKNDDSTKPILVRFSVHMIGQIIVHLMVVLVVAAKINNENPVIASSLFGNNTSNASINATSVMDDDDGDVNASYFLIIAMVSGGIVPLAGSAMFFVVNYYWMRQFSISFWVNMISLLQGESFAEAVFGGEGVSSKEKALEFVQQSQFSKVKKELKKYKSPTLFTKLRFPAQVPGLVVVGIIYNAVFLIFIVSLMFSYDDDSITLVVFRQDHLLSVMFVVATLSLIVANIHVLILMNSLIVLFTISFVTFVVLIVFVIILSVTVVFPALGGVGFSLLLIDLCSSLFICKSHHGLSTEYSSSNEIIRNGSIDSISSNKSFQEHNYQQFPDSETKL